LIGRGIERSVFLAHLEEGWQGRIRNVEARFLIFKRRLRNAVIMPRAVNWTPGRGTMPSWKKSKLLTGEKEE
jgi:hypothetical protein